MPPMTEKLHTAAPEKFKSPQEELAYLRQRVAEKEHELESAPNQFEKDRITKREIEQYAAIPEAEILHEAIIMPNHDILQHVLKLEPEDHDTKIDELLKLVSEKGIRNALSVVARFKNAHLEDDLHRALVRYVAEGMPDHGMAPPEQVRKALNLVLFEIHPQAHGEGDQKEIAQHKLEQLLSSSEQLYAGLISLIEEGEGYSLEIAVPQGTEEASLYLAVPHQRKVLAERLISSVFPNARIVESRGDYNIFNFEGEHAASYATLADHPALPLKTPEMFEHDPMNILLAAFAKIAKHGEGAALQITVGTEGDRYNHHYKKILRELEKGKSFREALKIPETELGEAVRTLAKQLFSSKEQQQKELNQQMRRTSDQVSTEEITRKVKTRIAPVSIRLVTSAQTHARAKDLLRNVETAFAQYDDSKGNRLVLKKVGSWSMSNFLRDFTYRTFDRSIAMPLSLGELTAIYHFTAERLTTSRELKRSFGKQSPAPVATPADGIILGINQYGADETKVHFGQSD